MTMCFGGQHYFQALSILLSNSVMRTKVFTGLTSKFWKNATALEVFKFSFYLIVPIGASFIYANPKVMKEIILNLNYVQYPKATPSNAWENNDSGEQNNKRDS